VHLERWMTGPMVEKAVVYCEGFEMTRQMVDSLLECVRRHVHILDATVAVKQDFADIIEGQENLRLIQLSSWAGLGAVQYVFNVLFIYVCMSVYITRCIVEDGSNQRHRLLLGGGV